VPDLAALLAGSVPPGVRRYVGRRSPQEVVALATEAAWQPYLVELAAVRDKRQLIDALVHALELPDWTGRNWDALEEALGDVAWAGAQRVLLVLAGSGPLASADPDAWRTARAILRDATAGWHERGVVLQVLSTS
jgi:hypothetical protein